MKKLFLYMRYVIILFTVFYLGSYIVSVNTLGKNITSDKNEKIELTGISNTEDAVAVDGKNNNRFIIGARNGHVVVYYNDYDNIYEYTGISMNHVKLNDKAAYDKIIKNYILYNEKEVYSFLQSISN